MFNVLEKIPFEILESSGGFLGDFSGAVVRRGTLRDIGLLLSSLALFVASTRLKRSRVGAIDTSDHSRQVSDQ